MPCLHRYSLYSIHQVVKAIELNRVRIETLHLVVERQSKVFEAALQVPQEPAHCLTCGFHSEAHVER
jgi:hypothetical protein